MHSRMSFIRSPSSSSALVRALGSALKLPWNDAGFHLSRLINKTLSLSLLIIDKHCPYRLSSSVMISPIMANLAETEAVALIALTKAFSNSSSVAFCACSAVVTIELRA